MNILTDVVKTPQNCHVKRILFQMSGIYMLYTRAACCYLHTTHVHVAGPAI